MAAIDTGVESSYRWYSADNFLVTWTNWKQYQPNGENVENCIVRDANGEWQDVACSTSYQFYCEEIEGMLTN